MDDTARLVSELHGRLAELDGKVAAYQRDMLAEFNRHMDDCLRGYPDHVSSEVSRVIAESMSSGRYPALQPATRVLPGSPAAPRNIQGSPISPQSPALSSSPNEGARSPHARELEFQGLFTPTYLPLLESNDRLYRSPPMSPTQTASGAPSLPLSVDNVNKMDEAKPSVPDSADGRPDPRRRLTGQSTSSIESSGSEARARRSALRRSSGSNKGSPRRVRFDFHGQEVYPSSSSPLESAVTATTATTTTTTPALADEAEPQAKADDGPAVAVEDESSAYTGPSLLDVEGEEDSLPRPVKVSSTQALQALTRSPLDDGTVWRVVNPDPDPDPEVTVVVNGEKQDGSAVSEMPLSKEDSQQSITSSPDDMADGPLTHQVLGSPIEDLGNYDDGDDTSSDEDYLSMKPRRRTPAPTARKPPANNPPVRSAAAAREVTTAELNGRGGIDDGDNEPLFDFDEDAERTLSQHQKRAQKYLPESDEDEDGDDEDDGLEISAQRRGSLPIRNNPASPPEQARDREPSGSRDAAGRRAGGDGGGDASRTAPATSAVLFGHSIGSYKGRSVTVAPIKDPKLYEEIAGMKDVHFFVGSIDGRSGVEPADLGSYRAASVAKNVPAGTPRSFTQRLALEEAMERRRAAGEEVDEA